MQQSVLVVNADDGVRLLMRFTLTRAGFRVYEATGAAAALQMARHRQPDVIVLDNDLGGTRTGVDIAADLATIAPRSRVLINGDTDAAASSAGVHEVLNKSAPIGDMLRRVEALASTRGRVARR